jgi:hypothetical protein
MSSRGAGRKPLQGAPKHPKRKAKAKGGSKNASKGQQQYGNIHSIATVVPNELFIKLHYVEQFTLNAALTSTDNYVFRANSLFDPNYTGSGHQPYGYDQWTTFYTGWVVEKCAISFTCTPPNLSTASPQIDNAILYLTKRRTDPSAFADINTAIEDPFCVRYVMTSGYQKQPKLSTMLDIPSFLGIDRTTYLNSAEYSGATGSNPAVQAYLICGAGSTAAGTTNPDPMYCTAELTFFCKFYNAANLTGSSIANHRIVHCRPGPSPDDRLSSGSPALEHKDFSLFSSADRATGL